jgi:hypothetical protein
LAHKYDISYYGIVLSVGIGIIVLDTYAILVKYLRGKMAGEKKMTNQLCVLYVVKTVIYYNDFTNGKYETYI